MAALITFIRPAPMWSSKDKDIFNLMAFQKNEEVLSQEQYFRNFELPIETRVFKGIALTNLIIQELDSPKKFRLSCIDENNSKFRIGDYIKIHCGIEFDSNRAEALIIFEGDNYYDILLIRGALNHYIINKILIIIDYSFSNISGKIIHNALLNLEKNNDRNFILNIINGKTKINTDSDAQKKLKSPNFYSGSFKKDFIRLDEFQRKAFIKAIVCTPISLIQGPPGTGKTFLLAFLCNFLASEGKNILITGFTHRSINNALIAIWKGAESKEKIIKISDEYNASEFVETNNSIPVFKRFDQSPYKRRVNSGLIVGATPYEVTRSEFDGIKFDYVIFDEASQIHVNLAIMAMLRGSKYVFFGDHMQMKPIILGNSSINPLYKKQIFNRSIFEFLFGNYGGITLCICYRMNPKLISFSSTSFYNGRVTTPSKNNKKILKFLLNPTKHKEVLNPRNVDVVVKIIQSKDKLNTKNEATLIGEFVEELIKCGIKPNDIGIVAPYRPQLTIIKRELRRFCAESDNIIVETIERIQGQERDVLIFSMTKSNFNTSIEDLEFFFTPNRLNVALTRAKCKRIVVCHETLFSKQKINKTIDKKIKYFTEFLNNADEIITYPL